MSSKTVLLCDDDADIRFIAEIALVTVGGLTVTMAASTEEARAHLEQALPDVILLDVTMPDCDGPTFLAQLRATPAYAHVPIIFLTARTGLEDIRHYLDLGAAGVISKPFDPMSLAKQIGDLLNW